MIFVKLFLSLFRIFIQMNRDIGSSTSSLPTELVYSTLSLPDWAMALTATASISVWRTSFG